MKGKCVLHDTNVVIPEENLHLFNYNMLTFPPLLLKLLFLSIAIKEMTCYNNLNVHMKFPDKSVLCLRRKSESRLWSSACMQFPGSACLLLRNEHGEGE